MEIDRSFNLNLRLTRVHSVLIRRIGAVSVMNDTTPTRRPPSTPCFERADTPGSDSVARQRALVGDSLNDEQWSDDLFNPS